MEAAKGDGTKGKSRGDGLGEGHSSSETVAKDEKLEGIFSGVLGRGGSLETASILSGKFEAMPSTESQDKT